MKLEAVGAQQRRDHVDGEADRGGAVEDVDEHGRQTLRSNAA